MPLGTTDGARGPSRERVLQWGRWLAYPLAGILFFEAARHVFAPAVDPPWYFRSLGGLEVAVGLVLLLPARRLATNRAWWRFFGVLAGLSVLFVFGRVIGVLFEARAIEAAGGELGLPGWTGTLVFLVLAQIPIQLFSRFPDQLD